MTYPNANRLTYDYGSSGLNFRISRLNTMTDGTNTILTPQYLGLGTVVEGALGNP